MWDLKPVELEKVHYVLPKRRCGCCGKLSTATVPYATARSVAYGPNVNAAAILLFSQGNVPVEATARPMAALLGTARTVAPQTTASRRRMPAGAGAALR